MFVHRGQRTQSQAFSDFFERWRVAMLLYELGNEVVHFPLSACDRHEAIVSERKAKSRVFNGHCFTTETQRHREQEA